MAHAPGRLLIFAISPRSVLASGSRHRACGACFSALGSPIKRRDRFIRRAIPKRRLTFKKRLLEALSATVDAHPNKTIRLYFQDEARVGQKGRLCHRRWPKGQRLPGRCDKRFKWASIFGAVAPETGDAFGLILPRADTPAMSIFLAEFAKTLPENEHAVMVLG